MDQSRVSDLETTLNSDFNIKEVLPSIDDMQAIHKNFSILLACTQHIPFYTEFGKGLEQHIQQIL